MASPYAGVRFNTTNLSRDRHTTDRQRAKEITDKAIRDGRSISKAPGGRRATEKYVDGKGWVKV